MSVRIATGGAADQAAGRSIARLVDERIASGITAQDPTLWGPAAEAAAVDRLGWTEAVADARGLVPAVSTLRTELTRAGVSRVALIAGTGTSTAASAIAGSQGFPLTVLGLDPDRIGTALGGAADTVVVIAEAPGSGFDGQQILPAVLQALRHAGVDADRRIVAVAPPGSALDAAALTAGLRRLPAAAAADDRFCALTAAALVPSGLAGADLAELLDEAESEELNLAIDDPSNNGLRLAALLAAAERDDLAVVADGTHLVGFDVWAAHLLGAAGLAARAVAPGEPEVDGVPLLRFVADAHESRATSRLPEHEIHVSGSLGELLLALEYAAVVAARLRGTDPFGRRAPTAPTAAEGIR